MRIFATREYQLSRLPLGARLFYTLFLSMVLLGLLSCLGFMWAKSGMTAGAVAEYYRQEDLGLGGKPFLELLETAHFHLFTMPIFFLVLGHIFFLSSWSDRAKLVVVATSFVSLVAEIVLPFLIVYHSGRWAVLEHASRTTFFVTSLLFIAVPLREMWSGPTSSGAAPRPRGRRIRGRRGGATRSEGEAAVPAARGD
ncbi:MAG: hypothetical protein HY899_06205 [Deltaproteobacteria bacterium]|nr:hypothetical protein [Deltaproteobacteria bacterium]